VGTAKASHLIEQPKWDLPLLADLSLVMRDASICGLGQAAPNPSIASSSISRTNCDAQQGRS
jgi:NADH:ubiquinone oxidoreductase subunit F (NADH-binding)